MPLHFIRPRLAGWLIAAAALQYPALSSAMESHNAGPTPVRQEQMLAALPPDAEQPPSAEPFGQIAVPITSGDSLNRWRFVENEIDAESAIVDRCLTQQECPAAARKFLDIVGQGRARSGLARVGVINRAVNLAIAPESDIDQWGVPDRWSPPLETLTTGHGDCEDYAIAKYAALLRAGMSRKTSNSSSCTGALPMKSTRSRRFVSATSGLFSIIERRCWCRTSTSGAQRRWSFWIPAELK